MTSAIDKLSDRQRELVALWLPDMHVERDMSWDLVQTTVLRVTQGGSAYVVKAAGSADGHIEREVRAHQRWLEPWRSRGRSPVLQHHDVDAKIIVTRYLPGDLVLGHAAEGERATYEQAGELLALMHGQSAAIDDDHEARENARVCAALAADHRIENDLTERLRTEVESWPTPPATLVPTHGDWQPRNWLIHEGKVSVIDFGRSDLRPALTDFARLARQEFVRDAEFEAAFLSGYGSDPREPAAWYRAQLREAIGTAVWAYKVGDEDFEKLGHRMIARLFEAPVSDSTSRCHRAAEGMS